MEKLEQELELIRRQLAERDEKIASMKAQMVSQNFRKIYYYNDLSWRNAFINFCRNKIFPVIPAKERKV